MAAGLTGLRWKPALPDRAPVNRATVFDSEPVRIPLRVSAESRVEVGVGSERSAITTSSVRNEVRTTVV